MSANKNPHARTSQEMDNLSFDDTYAQNTVLPLEEFSGTLLKKQAEGMSIPRHDYVGRGWVAGTFTETWTFKSGGAGGDVVATITIVYDDVNQSNIVTVTQT